MAIGRALYAAVQRAAAQIKIISNECGRKKFLLDRFWRELGVRHHFSAAMNVLASYGLTHLTADHQKFVSYDVQ
jgi:hypothetical protein